MLRIRMPKRRIFVAIAILAIAVPIITYATLQSGAAGDSQRAAGPNGSLEVELITLRPSGFEPSEITRPKDSFVLFIDDRSGKENSSLTLHRINGERLRAVSLNRKKTEWYDVVDLPPGTYVLQDANNSDLRCQITVLP